MKELITHLNCFNLNPTQYWVVPDVFCCGSYEIIWTRTVSGCPVWKIRLKAEDERSEWEELHNENVLSEFSNRGVDLVEFRNQLSETILKQAVYATQIADSAKFLLGKEEVDHAVQEANLLVEEIIGKIKKVIKGDNKKRLHLVPEKK